MGTRACIARKTATGFTGVYHHWDGYPTALGKTLQQLHQGFFQKSTDRMLTVLVDLHPAGWSTINNADFTKAAGYADRSAETGGPMCYCHGTRKEESRPIDEKNASDCGCEWAYVIEGDTMSVLSSYRSDGNKMIGAFGMGDPRAKWRVVAEVKFGEPFDFESLE